MATSSVIARAGKTRFVARPAGLVPRVFVALLVTVLLFGSSHFAYQGLQVHVHTQGGEDHSPEIRALRQRGVNPELEKGTLGFQVAKVLSAIAKPGAAQRPPHQKASSRLAQEGKVANAGILTFGLGAEDETTSLQLVNETRSWNETSPLEAEGTVQGGSMHKEARLSQNATIIGAQELSEAAESRGDPREPDQPDPQGTLQAGPTSQQADALPGGNLGRRIVTEVGGQGTPTEELGSAQLGNATSTVVGSAEEHPSAVENVASRVVVGEYGLEVEVIEKGLRGALHEEPGFAQWNDLVVILGSFNVTKEYAPFLAAAHPERVPELFVGSSRTSVYNLTSREVRPGPELPVLMHHPAAAISPGGVVHLVGSGDWSDVNLPNNDSYHFVWNVSGGPEVWSEAKGIPGAAGGFSCAFVGELMYCCGGGRRLQEPTSRNVRVYDPAKDSWREVAPLPEPADHITLVVHEQELWAVGGASTLDPGPDNNPQHFGFDHFRHSINQLAVHNPGADRWRVKQPNPTPRAGSAAAVIQRPGKRPSMLVGGGEVYLGGNGIALSLLSEYDFVEDAWFCFLDPLPFPVFGTATGLLGDKWYILGGGESFQLAATDRVMVLDVTKLPIPEPCAPQGWGQKKDWWKGGTSSWLQNFPYPKQFLHRRA